MIAKNRKMGSAEANPIFSTNSIFLTKKTNYIRNDIKTPAATAEPITPEILLAIQY